MSTTSTSPTTGTRSWPAWAAGSTGLAVVLTAIGTFWSPLASYEATQTMDDLREYLILLAIMAVGVAVAFGLVVRTASPARSDRRGLVLTVVSVLSIAVFWTGLPAILAGAGVCCALANGRPSTVGKVTLAIGVLVTGVAIWLALAG